MLVKTDIIHHYIPLGKKKQKRLVCIRTLEELSLLQQNLHDWHHYCLQNSEILGCQRPSG